MAENRFECLPRYDVKKLITKGHKGTWDVIKIFYILIMVIISWMTNVISRIVVKTH